MAFGTRVGVAYDQMAGKRAVAEGRDLGSLKNQLEVKERLNRGQKVLDDYRDTMADLENPTPQGRDFFPDPLQDQYSTGMGEKGDATSKAQEIMNLLGAPGGDLYQDWVDKTKDLTKKIDHQVRWNEDQDLLDENRTVKMGKKEIPWNDVYKQLAQSPRKIYEFHVDTGKFYESGTKLTTGYSGYGTGKNNPEMMDVKNIGPIPMGYTL